jgi:hypothetical protein
MTERCVYIFMPTYGGSPRAETFHALVHEVDILRDRGWFTHTKFTVGDSLIARARNMAVADFLHNPKYTDLVMIDDDVNWEDGALARLLSHPCDVVAGLYPKRSEPMEFPCKVKPGAIPDANGLLEMRMVPTGFFRVQRHVLERMVAAYPERAYRDANVPGGKAHWLFATELGIDPDDPAPEGIMDLWGEDFAFCRLWTAIGGRIFADTLLHFQHIGRKAYDGCYAEHYPYSPHFTGNLNSAA